jgi:hypothetical protein
MSVDRVIPGKVPPAVVNGEKSHSSDGAPRNVKLPDLAQVIPLALEGDNEATRVLFQYTKGIVKTRFQQNGATAHGDGVVDELTGKTLEKVFTEVLQRYDPDLPMPDHIPEAEHAKYRMNRYEKYVRRVAHSRYVDYLRAEGRSKVPYIEVPRYEAQDITGILMKQEGITKQLTPQQMEAMMLKAQGKTNPEIEQELRIEPGNLRVRLHRGRKKIEKTFLTPKGFKKYWDVYSWSKRSFHAYTEGHIQTVVFLGVIYVKQEWIDEYKKNYTDPPLPGYAFLLAMAISKEDKQYLKSNKSHPALATINRGGRWYAHPDNVRKFLAENPRKVTKQKPTQVYPD